MVKVVQFIHGFNMGGAETLVKDYCLGNNSHEVDLHVLCLEHRDSPYEKMLSDAGIRVTYLCDEMLFLGSRNIFARVINHFFLIYKIREYFRRVNPDVVHTHLAQNKYLVYAGLKKEIGIVYTHHYSAQIWKTEGKKDLRYAKILFSNHKAKLIVLNEQMKEELSDVFPKDCIEVINNGVFREKFSECNNKEDCKERIGIPKDAFVVGHVGRFCEAKNHSFLVDIFVEIRKKEKKAKLLLIGTGETLSIINNKIQRLGIQEDVIILENRTDVPLLLNAMDVLLFPSLYEGMPVTVIEAQFARLPCIVSTEVDPSIKISDAVTFMSLDYSAQEWAERALTFKLGSVEYTNADEWDMKKIIEKLQLIYNEISV